MILYLNKKAYYTVCGKVALNKFYCGKLLQYKNLNQHCSRSLHFIYGSTKMSNRIMMLTFYSGISMIFIMWFHLTSHYLQTSFQLILQCNITVSFTYTNNNKAHFHKPSFTDCVPKIIESHFFP